MLFDRLWNNRPTRFTLHNYFGLLFIYVYKHIFKKLNRIFFLINWLVAKYSVYKSQVTNKN